MRYASKAVALVAALLLVGTTRADDPKPAAQPVVPVVNKTTIYNGQVPTVSYTVQGGSPHLQALARSLQFTENEIGVTEELQRLRLGIVANEQTLDAVRTSQALGIGPIPTPGYAAACYSSTDSDLKRALIPGLACEATPATAYELINLWELQQTQLQAEQGRAAPAPRVELPANPNLQPVASTGPLMSIPHVGAPVAGPIAASRTLGPQATLTGSFAAQAAPQPPPGPMNAQQVLAFQQMVRARIAQAQQMHRQRL
jgi:hypothetical protein